MRSQSPTNRQTFAHAIVVCGIIFGLTSFVLAPLETKRSRGEKEVTALRLERTEAAERQQILQAASIAGERASELSEAIHHRSIGARDELALHRVFHETSARWGVEIDRFDPSAAKVSVPRRKDDELLRPSFAATVRIDAIGQLEGVVGMIDELTQTAGFMNVRSLKITPIADSAERTIRIRLECEHYSFLTEDSSRPTAEGDS